ncbi:MAG: hypothetical protein IT210_14095 [Armatimonadetes bacterium]|nr:hypothetical protein [Armatimonadota bacterium]
MRPSRLIFSLLWMLFWTVALPPPKAQALDYRQVQAGMVSQADSSPPPGKILIEDGSGSLDQWEATPGVIRAGQGPRSCLQIESSDRYERFGTKVAVPVIPGHEIVLCWKVRTVSGPHWAYVRMDYYDRNGKRLKTVEPWTGPSPAWRQESWPISRYPFERPPDTRSVTFTFFHAPSDSSATQFDDIRLIDLHPGAMKAIKSTLLRYRRMLSEAVRRIESAKDTSLSREWKRIANRQAGATAARLAKLDTLDPASHALLENSVPPLLFARRIADAAWLLSKGREPPALLLTYTTRPISPLAVLLYSPAVDGVLSSEAAVQGHPGEYEPVSLVLWSPENKRQNKQLWITVRIPRRAASGRYERHLSLQAGRRQIARIDLKVDVLPFDLPSPRTYYDPSKEFVYSLYYWGSLDPTGQGSVGWNAKTEEQFRVELRPMPPHGIGGAAGSSITQTRRPV